MQPGFRPAGRYAFSDPESRDTTAIHQGYAGKAFCFSGLDEDIIMNSCKGGKNGMPGLRK
jgi:hypothetical protein